MREAGLNFSLNQGAGDMRTTGEAVAYLNRGEREWTTSGFDQRLLSGKASGEPLEASILVGGECVGGLPRCV